MDEAGGIVEQPRIKRGDLPEKSGRLIHIGNSITLTMARVGECHTPKLVIFGKIRIPRYREFKEFFLIACGKKTDMRNDYLSQLFAREKTCMDSYRKFFQGIFEQSARNGGISRSRFLLVLAFVLLISASSGTVQAFPDITMPTLSYTETGGNTAANIGEVIRINCLATDTASTFNPPQPWVDLTPVGGPAVQYLTKGAGDDYSCNYTLTEGGTLNPGPTTLLIYARNNLAETDIALTNSITFDVVRPQVSAAGVEILVNGAVAGTPLIRVGTANWGFRVTDSRPQSSGAATTCQVTACTGTPAPIAIPQAIAHSGGGVYVSNYTPPANCDSVYTFTLRLTDPYNQAAPDVISTNVTIDTIAPNFTTATVQNLSGNAIARPGDALRITACLATADGNTVVASQTAVTTASPNFPITMTSGDGVNFTADVILGQEAMKYTTAPGMPIDLIATDNAGNTTTRRVYVLVDLDPPGFVAPTLDIYDAAGNLTGLTVAKISDRLLITATITMGIPSTDVNVSADLRPIGGPASCVMSLAAVAGNQYTYQGAYVIPVGTTENIPPTFVFTVTACDAAGNVVWQFTTPPILVDNSPPVITNALAANFAGGTTIKLGDYLRVSCSIASLDGGPLPWVDMRRIGGQASQTLTDLGGGNYQIVVLVGTATPNWINGYDAVTSFSVRTNDDVGNPGLACTNNVTIDNQPPLFVNATWTVTPSLGASHTWIHMGDVVSFTVLLDNTINDTVSVVVNLASVSVRTTNLTLTQVSPGAATFTGSFVIPEGPNNNDVNIPITIVDNAGNPAWWSDLSGIAQASTTLSPFDQCPPVRTGSFTVALQKKNPAIDPAFGRDAYANLNRTLTFAWPVSDPDGGNCTVDLNLVGDGQFAPLTWTFNPTPSSYTLVWPATYTGTTTLTNSSYQFIATLTDKAGNWFCEKTSTTHWTDTIPPAFVLATWTCPTAPSNHPYVRINDVVTLRVELNLPQANEVMNVIADLSSLNVSPANKALTLVATTPLDPVNTTAVFLGSFTVPVGSCNDGATIPVSIMDDAGNPAYNLAFTATVTASITIGLFDQYPLYPSGRLVVTPTKIDPTVDPNISVQHVNVNRTLLFGWPIADPDNGTCTIDLSLVGFGSNDQMTWANTPLPASYCTFLTASYTGQTATAPNYSFIATMTDKAGNAICTTTATIHNVDCIPPELLYPNVFVRDNLVATSATLGDWLRFTVYATPPRNEQNWQPRLQQSVLGRIGASQSWAMNPITWTATDATHFFDFQIRQAYPGYTGYLNASGAFPIRIQDGLENWASATAETDDADHTIVITNQPPPGTLTPILVATNATATSPLFCGQQIRWQLVMDPAVIAAGVLDTTSVRIDLSMLGSSSSVIMTYDGANSFLATWTNTATSTEVDNYFVTATVRDVNTTTWSYYWGPAEIDCHPPEFITHSIYIAQDNGDNFYTWVGNTGDVINVVASLTLPFDFTLTAGLATGATIFTTQTMAQVGSIWVATFTVTDPSGVWGSMNWATVSYYLTAIDHRTNTATAAASATFMVDNVPPVIDLTNSSWSISPDILEPGYINVGSGAWVDVLVATMSFTGGERVASAWININDYPGAPGTSALTISGCSAGSGAVRLASFSSQDVLNPAPTFSITMIDYGGNRVATSPSPNFNVDTLRPTIASAAFDGQTLTVQFQTTEQVDWGELSRWTIHGRTTDNLATSTTLDAAGGDVLNIPFPRDNFFTVSVSQANQIMMANWGQQPLTLWVANDTATPGVRDIGGNWGYTTANVPITLTDTVWRENPVIASFEVFNTWPTEVQVRFTFSKAMATTTLNLTQGVLFAEATFDTTGLHYPTRYVLRPEDNNITWSADAKVLMVRLSEEGREWVARKIASGTTTLKFATRSTDPAYAFIKDQYQKVMLGISTLTAPPIEASVTRVPVYAFEIDDGRVNPEPFIDFRQKLIRLNFLSRAQAFLSEEVVLSQNDFQVGTPTIIATAPANPITSFRDKFELHNFYGTPGMATFAVLSLDPLDTTKNPLAASVSADLTMSDADLAAVLQMIRTSTSTPVWSLKVNESAFPSWWGQWNMAYVPIGPSNVSVASIGTTQIASLIAVSINDFPPTRNASIGDLALEFEIQPDFIGNVAIPIASTTPRATIMDDASNTWLATCTFQGWSTRQVDGRDRYIARFTNANMFPANLDSRLARAEIRDVRDIFGTTMSYGAATTVFDINGKTTTGTGFSATATNFIVDTLPPSLSVIVPMDVIPLLAAGAGVFDVTFSENMDSTVFPSLILATSTGLGAQFTFTLTNPAWISSTTARFNNDQAIDTNTPNGTWTYTLSGGQDVAGNPFPGDSRLVQIRSHAPAIQPATGTVILTIQGTVSNSAVLQNMPFSSDVWPNAATLTVEYYSDPENPPHSLRVFDSGNNIVASGPLTIVSRQATFSLPINLITAGTGRTPFTVKVIDSQANETGVLNTLYYDRQSAVLDRLALGNIGTLTGGVYYYAPSLYGDANCSVHVTTGADADLRVTVWSSTGDAGAGVGATNTVILSNTSVGTYSNTFGSLFTEGSYIIRVVDAAGNLNGGVASITLVADRTPPAVVSIEPSNYVGNSPAGAVPFIVTYNEPLDPGTIPVLVLGTDTATITMDFAGWSTPGNATTANFLNHDAITSILPSGSYTYRLTGGRDWALNNVPSSVGVFSVNVQSKGPQPNNFDYYTRQPVLFGTSDLANRSFSGTVNPGIATIAIGYGAGPFNLNHQLLVYDQGNTLVATFAVPPSDPATVTFDPATIGAALVDPTGPVQFHFRLRDGLGNISEQVVGSMTYDSLAPTITAFTFNDHGHGIASLGFRYYSPAFGNADISLMTTAQDDLILVVGSGTATLTYGLAKAIAGGIATHSVSAGSSLPDGIFVLTSADLAGNMANGTAASLTIMVDSVNPSVATITPGPGEIGAMYPGDGQFDITFSELMNAGATPAASIDHASSPFQVTLQAQQWISSTTLRFTNTGMISATCPQGLYYYHVSGGTDYAGNPLTSPGNTDYPITIRSQGPQFVASISTQQNLIATTPFYNYPLSTIVPPGVGTMTVKYFPGPYSIPHIVRIYDPSRVQVATLTLATVTPILFDTLIDPTTFVPAPAIGLGPISYNLRIIDTLGNISATSSTVITYDTLAPSVSTFTVGGVSGTATYPYIYYNRSQLLSVSLNTNATDALRLVVASGTATRTFALSQSGTVHGTTFTDSSWMTPGTYTFTAVDMAGNFANGTASMVRLIVDTDAPVSVAFTSIPPSPFYTMPTGAATFTVTFNEPMNTAIPVSMSISTSTMQIRTRFVGWLSSTQARFTNDEPVTEYHPQGQWNVSVSGMDMAGNMGTTLVSTVTILSRGPVLGTILARSFQSTTASSPAEILFNQPFSPAVPPNEATFTVTLNASPSALPVVLQFFVSPSTVPVASFPIPMDPTNTVGTYTWTAGTGPVPSGPTTYQLKVADGFGNTSLESFTWTLDASAPILFAAPKYGTTGGYVSSSAIYFNPKKPMAVTTKFNIAGETTTPVLRVRGINSTDTYVMTSAGSNAWNGVFDGFHSRNPSVCCTDGTYFMDVVDQAGNIAVPNGTFCPVATAVIDTVPPTVLGYGFYVNQVPKTRYAVGGASLTIEVRSAEPLTETGIWWAEIRDSFNLFVRRVPLVASGPLRYVAMWDGLKEDGKTKVTDGNYRVQATDFARNAAATASSQIYVVSSVFALTNVTQYSARIMECWFSQDIASPTGAVVTVNPAVAGGYTLVQTAPRRFRVIFNGTPVNGTPYTVTVTNLRSTLGVDLVSPYNSFTTLAIDTVAPLLSSVTMQGLSGNRDFYVVFNETVTTPTANETARYVVTNSAGTVTISSAILQSDGKTVLVSAATNIPDNVNSVLNVSGVEDAFRNASVGSLASYTFKGRDMTAPSFEIAAFSNPGNDYDIIVVVRTSETLNGYPSLEIDQSGMIQNPAMTPMATSGLYTASAHLDPNYSGYVTLTVTGTDPAGNTGKSNDAFSVAVVSASVKAAVVTPDTNFQAEFDVGNLNRDTYIKIFRQRLELQVASGSSAARILPRLASPVRMTAIRGNRVRELVRAVASEPELQALDFGYEVSFPASNLGNSFRAMGRPTNHSAAIASGVALFQQNDQGTWEFVSVDIKGGWIVGRVSKPGLFALLKDELAPRISLKTEIDPLTPFDTARPVIEGTILENGSGLKEGACTAIIDGGEAQTVTVGSDGRFSFQPMESLTGGEHVLVFQAQDRVGNRGTSSDIRFQIKVALSIGEIVNYPNPAKEKSTLRISANRADISADMIEVKIYDVAGHAVRELSGINPVREAFGTTARFLYDIPWDLRNEDGERVANGVYFARIRLSDPDDPSRTVKKTHKIAVLR